MYGLEKLCFSLSWSLAQCSGALRQPHFAAFGLFTGKTLIAYISFYHTQEELEIANLAVRPAFRRAGHGRRLLRLALHTARKMGMQKAVLEVRDSNQAAISLYESMGFVHQGIRPHYFSDTGENARVYVRQLDPW